MRESRYNVWVEHDGTAAVFNGVSGTLCVMRPGEREGLAEFLGAGRLEGLTEARARQMVEARILVADEVDELALLRTRYNALKLAPDHLGLTVVTSLGCNFDCPYCFEAKHPAIISDEVQRAVLRVLDDSIHRLTNLNVTWMGGEPLVGKRALLQLSDEFIARCDRHGVTYSSDIVTNGWHLTPQTCDELAARRVTNAQVTIDGPPDVHDRMRPLVGGGSTFGRIVENLHHAAERMSVSVRINIDTTNLGRVEELLQLLADDGLIGKIGIYPGRLGAYENNPLAPTATYESACYQPKEWSEVQLEVDALIAAYGFAAPSLPTPVNAPCTAVATNELIVGAEGEIWKCWNEIGDPTASAGDIRDYMNMDQSRLRRWLRFDPADDPQCSTCIAMPVCMGGCPYETFAGNPRDMQCGTFRLNHVARVERFLASHLGKSIHDLVDITSLPHVAASRASVGSVASSSGGCGSGGCGSGACGTTSNVSALASAATTVRITRKREPAMA